MTQSLVFDNSIDTQLTTPSHINLQTDFLGVEHPYHDNYTSLKSPEAKIPTVACIYTPMVHYPNRGLISALLPPVKSYPSHKLKRQIFQDAKVDKKK